MPDKRSRRPPSHADPVLARAIETLRTARGFTQERLAQGMGCSEATLSRWESAQQTPQQRNLDRFLATLGLPPDALDRTVEYLNETERLFRRRAEELGYPEGDRGDDIADSGAPSARAAIPDPALRSEIDRVSARVGDNVSEAIRTLLRGMTSVLVTPEASSPVRSAPDEDDEPAS